MFLCNITKFRVIFKRLYLLLIYLCLLYTLSYGKMKTWFIDMRRSIGVYLNDFDKSNITSLVGRLLNVEKSAFSLMFCADEKFFLFIVSEVPVIEIE